MDEAEERTEQGNVWGKKGSLISANHKWFYFCKLSESDSKLFTIKEEYKNKITIQNAAGIVSPEAAVLPSNGARCAGRYEKKGGKNAVFWSNVVCLDLQQC